MYMEILENGAELCIALYFMLTDLDWRIPYTLGAAIIIVLMLTGILWMPESPQYLYESKRYKECKDAL